MNAFGNILVNCQSFPMSEQARRHQRSAADEYSGSAPLRSGPIPIAEFDSEAFDIRWVTNG